MKKILLITNIFPNNILPHSGTFNVKQTILLSKSFEIRVIAPVPWLLGTRIFSSCRGFGRVGKVEKEEMREGLKVYHPKIYNIPKLYTLSGIIYFLCVLRTVYRIRLYFNFEAIFATWAYPDSYVALLIAKIFRVPLIVKVHGSDINQLKNRLVKRMVKYTLRNAHSVVCVSEDLKNKLIGMNINPEKIKVIYNGVDFNIFRPMDKYFARKKLSLPIDKKIVVYIGNLKALKGLQYLLRALSVLKAEEASPDSQLFIVGEGPYKKELENEVERYKLNGQVTFVGVKGHGEIPLWINSSDVVTLPSLSEGMPNVVLESLACGRPVVATNVGGIPEVLNDEKVGIVVPPKHEYLLAEALDNVLKGQWDENHIVQHVARFTWESNAADLEKVIMNSLKVDMTVKERIKKILSVVLPRSLCLLRGGKGSKKVALTFDDGPNPDYTPQVLDILKEHKIKATFFVIGNEAQRYPWIVERIIKEGHEIGNHSYSHRPFKSFNFKKINEEIKATQKIIKNITGKMPSLFRLPKGEWGFTSLLYVWICLLAKKMTLVFWSLDLRDYSIFNQSEIIERILKHNSGAGDIFLLHDKNSYICSALPKIIGILKQSHLGFATVSELIAF